MTVGLEDAPKLLHNRNMPCRDPDVHARTVLIAGGGSGGHISPGLAVAERLIETDPNVKVIFACSQRAIDARMLTAAGAEFVALPAAPLSLRPLGLFRFLRGFRAAKRQAAELIRARGVSDTITMGGFVAAPVVVAANFCNVPVTLVNLDSPPGKANRWMARRCQRVVSAIPVDDPPGFANQVVGVPIRRSVLAPGDHEFCRRALGLDENKFTLLVTGASQGSRSVNRLVSALAQRQPETFRGWQVYHLTGAGEDREVRNAYTAAGVAARVEPFTDRMGFAWGAADLAVSRAGANSVAEVHANAVPTLFLPYPWHKDRHQFRNAQPLVQAGAAVVETDHIDEAANLEHGGQMLQALMADADRREAMRAAARRSRPADAAMTIAELVLTHVSHG
jgi:UDP-N-acetylglucosamine--N-acetylmuramyl-(pentapeptide) pyrophosphoryl-undecaprenol N-acetylglucosamine transferase